MMGTDKPGRRRRHRRTRGRISGPVRPMRRRRRCDDGWPGRCGRTASSSSGCPGSTPATWRRASRDDS